MRILIVHNLLWAHYKAAVFEALQREAAKQTNVQVHVLQIARNERSRAGMETTAAEAPVYQYSYDLLFDRYFEDTSPTERAKALLNRARAYKPDVITLTGYYDPAQLALLFWAKLRGIRIIMQNESTTADNQRTGPKEAFKRWLISLFDGFFCFGSRSADYLLALNVPPRKILLRKNAVDNQTLRRVYEQALSTRQAEQQHLRLPSRNFIYVGRLIGVKNVPALLTAFAQARQQAPAADWGLILLGDGADQPTLFQQTTELGLTNVVSFQPAQPWYRVPAFLALSDVLVLPSQSEPWGLVVNEAMVCGLPVIVSSQCGCVPDLVRDGTTGFVFDPANTDQLTQLLTNFMTGRVDTRAMRQAALDQIAPYAPEVVAREMLAGFTKVTA
ncbi:glycosyltransferase involved in cell wall biosynthesis [Spirosoma oryzae]|uniref:Glycosyltransferase involved in cell wall biosynthesis n=1 Tax=Spirosoma oryzae TaxID=1469603 RepID=A0A2T0SUH9_9BACT|nr:glycosyltransferase family 4 protein [Spirosoma oryzae]PRY37013.1 glycosyltransferase involved in cell wall biosynthesis [Spirosoma oryzae]